MTRVWLRDRLAGWQDADGGSPEWRGRVEAALSRHGDRYALDEIADLAQLLLDSRDRRAIDKPDDFQPTEAADARGRAGQLRTALDLVRGELGDDINRELDAVQKRVAEDCAKRNADGEAEAGPNAQA